MTFQTHKTSLIFTQNTNEDILIFSHALFFVLPMKVSTLSNMLNWNSTCVIDVRELSFVFVNQAYVMCSTYVLYVHRSRTSLYLKYHSNLLTFTPSHYIFMLNLAIVLQALSHQHWHFMDQIHVYRCTYGTTNMEQNEKQNTVERVLL